MSNVLAFDPTPRLPKPGSGLVARKIFLVVEVVPGGKLRVTRPDDLKQLTEGRVTAREFVVLETEEEGKETASVLAAENPGRCFLCVEAAWAAFEVAR